MTKRKESFKIKICLALVFSFTLYVLSFSGCSLTLAEPVQIVQPSPDQADGPVYEAVATNAEQIELAWDPSPSEVQSYRVLYRVHGAGEWVLAGEVPATDPPAYTLRHADFGNGSFDFAVTAVSAAGAESGMLSSLDQTSQPGWYLSWTD